MLRMLHPAMASMEVDLTTMVEIDADQGQIDAQKSGAGRKPIFAHSLFHHDGNNKNASKRHRVTCRPLVLGFRI